MVDSWVTTLWELFNLDGGSYNHAWSGGPLTHMYKYIAGIRPELNGYEQFVVYPNPVHLKRIDVAIPTVKGEILFNYSDVDGLVTIKLTTPKATTAVVRVPKESRNLSIKARESKELTEREDSSYRYYKVRMGAKDRITYIK